MPSLRPALLPLAAFALIALVDACGEAPPAAVTTGARPPAETGAAKPGDATPADATPVDPTTVPSGIEVRRLVERELAGRPGRGRGAEAPAIDDTPVEPAVVQAAIDKGLAWMREAQDESGGFGAGMHNRQDVRDPHAVKLDPATTAFVTLTLLRADGGRIDGTNGTAIRKAVAWLVQAIETGPKDGPQITTLTGTQPQTKLGASVDTAMAAQCLARVTPLLADDALQARAKAALAVCIAKLESSQQANGTWGGGGGWAPVLQASMANQALELSQRAGMRVSREVLRKSRNFQQTNIDGQGRVAAGRGGNAGVELYSFAGANRALAPRAARAAAIRKSAWEAGHLEKESDALTPEAVSKVADMPMEEAAELIDAEAKMAAQSERLGDAALLRGFGNNGGEEFLSYLLTSEALVIAGGAKWTEWNERMGSRLSKIQTADGSWTGHHCITSPVFCTAAVLQVLTVTRDTAYLKTLAEHEVAKDAKDAQPK